MLPTRPLQQACRLMLRSCLVKSSVRVCAVVLQRAHVLPGRNMQERVHATPFRTFATTHASALLVQQHHALQKARLLRLVEMDGFSE